jgi:hypothetical protein
MVVVVGPSGVGKSSFLAAGVVRAVPATWRAHVGRPGDDPVGALATILEQESSGPYRGHRHATSVREPAALAAAFTELAARSGQTLAIVVDQVEELFTMCADDTARIAFAEVLAEASASPSVRVILGVRDDFLCRLEDLAPWRGSLARAVQILRVPGIDDLVRIISVPAKRRGLLPPAHARCLRADRRRHRRARPARRRAGRCVARRGSQARTARVSPPPRRGWHARDDRPRGPRHRAR